MHSEVGAESALDVGEAPACHRAGWGQFVKLDFAKTGGA